MTDDLVAFLRARLDADEAGARDAFGSHNDGGPEWTEISSGVLDAGGELHGIGDSAVSRHIARHDPARVLAEVDAKRDVLRLTERAHDYHATFLSGFAAAMEDALRKFALAYADHPDYRPEWAPGA